MSPYKGKVDELMSPVLGRTPTPLVSGRPESPLSNLLSDILVWSGKLYGEKPDFGVYNIGGIRASLAQGDITIGDVFDVAPFENKVCFLLDELHINRLKNYFGHLRDEDFPQFIALRYMLCK